MHGGHSAFRRFAAPILWMASLCTSDAGERYILSPSNTHVGFQVGYGNNPPTVGEFRAFEGELDVDFDRPEQSTVTVKIEAASIDTGWDLRNAFIRGPAFFNVSRHHDVTFESTAIRRTGPRTLEAKGDMTMLGVTRPLTLSVTLVGDPATINRVEGALTIYIAGRLKRSDFGMDAFVPLISDRVEVSIRTTLARTP